jgi:hypothetical protein
METGGILRISGTDAMAEGEHVPGDRNRGNDTMLRFSWFGIWIKKRKT